MENRLPDSSTAAEFQRRFVHPKPGRTLIVGSRVYEGREDRRALYAHAVGLDMEDGDGVDVVCNLEKGVPSIGRFDHVECISVLEHSRQPWKLAANLERLMVRGGTIYLSAPFVWRVHGYPDDFFRFTKSGIRSLFDGIAWQQLALAHEDLKMNDLVPELNRGESTGHPYLARTEVLGFGWRR